MPEEVARFVAFLVSGLADAVPAPGRAELEVVSDHTEPRSAADRRATAVTSAVTGTRHQLADRLEIAAARLRP